MLAFYFAAWRAATLRGRSDRDIDVEIFRDRTRNALEILILDAWVWYVLWRAYRVRRATMAFGRRWRFACV